MSSTTKEDLSNYLFSEPDGEVCFEQGGFKRIETSFDDSCSKSMDVHIDSGVQVHFVQVSAGDGPQEISLTGQGEIVHCLQTFEMGTLLRLKKEDGECTAWFPSVTGWGRFYFDKHQRIGISKGQGLSCQLEIYPRINLRVMRPEVIGEVAVFSYVICQDPTGQLFQELTNLGKVERDLYLKSEWFSASVPSDIWKYLINGSLYDPRADRKIGKRFKCQQCAYSWWTYFRFLYQETGKKIYGIMQDEVALSVLIDMGDNGEWGHGFWSDDIETHARFHLDGVHLLISQYEKTQEVMWLEAAERGVNFLSMHLMEELDDGSLWFLHDTIELVDKRHHFQSSLFGKSPGNSLCINTHVQALTVLCRLSQVAPDNANYAEMYERGLKALRRVLECRSGEIFFKFLIPWIVRNTIWTDCHTKVGRLVRGLEALFLQMVYWPLRRQFPRLVQPGGFTERDLTIAYFSHSYHNTNMKDFLELYQQDPIPWLRPYIEKGVRFACQLVQKLGVPNALRLSVYYVEFVEVLFLYSKLIDSTPPLNFHEVGQQIYQETDGYSLDYCALKTELCE